MGFVLRWRFSLPVPGTLWLRFFEKLFELCIFRFVSQIVSYKMYSARFVIETFVVAVGFNSTIHQTWKEDFQFGSPNSNFCAHTLSRFGRNRKVLSVPFSYCLFLFLYLSHCLFLTLSISLFLSLFSFSLSLLRFQRFFLYGELDVKILLTGIDSDFIVLFLIYYYVFISFRFWITLPIFFPFSN